jgi:nicotinamidase-related amidase
MKEVYFTKENIDKVAGTLLKNIEQSLASIREFNVFPAKTALLITDMQNYFLEPDSNAYIPSSPAIIDKINTLTEYAEANSMLTVLTLHTNTKQNAAMMGKWWKRLINANNSYAKLYDKIRVPRNAHIINKSQYDCFYGTNLDELLRHNDIETLIICGVMTNLCVETTARSAFVRGYRVILPIDATAAYNLEFHKSTCLNLAFGFAHICLTEDLWEMAND